MSGLIEKPRVVHSQDWRVREGGVHHLLGHSSVGWVRSKEPRHDIDGCFYWFSDGSYHSWEVVPCVVLPAVVSHNADDLEHCRVPLLQSRTSPWHAVRGTITATKRNKQII